MYRSPFVQKLIKGINGKTLEDNVTLHYFDSSNVGGARLLISHLIDQGYRRRNGK